jgi:N-acyl homoserine lactone hydrolase
MAVKNLSFLPAGFCGVDQSILDTRAVPGKHSVNLPIWVYLIETTDGPVLVDTGMPSSCVSNPLGLFNGEGSLVPQMKEEDIIINILERNGYHKNDLAYIISSHLHFDHAGGNGYFPDTEIVLQRSEFDAAMGSADYPEICRLPDLNYKPIAGDIEYSPGIHLISTPGHSPGHQSVLVETKESGSILLAIDAAYTRSNFEDEVPFAVNNQTDSDASISKLKELAQSEKAQVFYGHDVEQAKNWADRMVLS